MTPAIDMCALSWDAEGWRGYFGWFAREIPAYLGVFGPRLCQRAGADPAAYQEALARSPLAAVDVLVEAGGLAVDPDVQAEQLRQWGMRLVLHGGQWPIGELSGNEVVGEMARRHPDVYTAFAGVSLRDVDAAVSEIERAQTELGAAGVSLTPFIDAVGVLDSGCEKVFATAERLEMPVWIHAGMNFAAGRRMTHTTWQDIDGLATAHPDLSIVIGHGGWPWIREMVALCQRHPNVYIETSTHRASAMPRAGSGWEPLLFHARAGIRNKVLFGSTAWTTSKNERQMADEVLALDLPEDVTAAWLHVNAARLLRLDPPC